FVFFFFQAEDGIRGFHVTGVQTCALPISELRDRNAAARFDREAAERLRRTQREEEDDRRTAELRQETTLHTLRLERERHEQEARSEEHTSVLQSRENLVCRLLL